MNKNLQALAQNNPSINIIARPDSYIVLNPWNNKTIGFSFYKRQHLVELSNVHFPEELVAIYHKSKNMLEFIFTPVHNDEVENYSIKFDFHYMGNMFKCYYGRSSKTLELLSKSFYEVKHEPSLSDYRQLKNFRDYYNEKGFYVNLKEKFTPLCFYVRGPFRRIEHDYIRLSKVLNFYMAYFKRNTPQIIILKKDDEGQQHIQPCLSSNSEFPNSINAQQINPILLDIFSVANETNDTRLQFIFYYQILEYASYYYLNSKLKNKLSLLLKNPEISSKTNEYSKFIIEELKDSLSHRDDSYKLGLIITEFCTVHDIKNELNCNIEYFCKDIVFDGGLQINKLFIDGNSLNGISDDFLKLIKDNIEKIRNVLVHLRESRENKVILPTKRNDSLLKPYLYLLRRIAEIVSIHYE